MISNMPQSMPDILKPSNLDDRMFPAKVGEKFAQLRQEYRTKYGNDLIPPQPMRQDIVRWMQMLGRHENGDFRHTEAEFKSTKTIAQWLINVHREICNQPEVRLDEVIRQVKEDHYGGFS